MTVWTPFRLAAVRSAQPPQLKLPNGVPLISFGAPAAETGLSVQLKYIALKRITPGPIVCPHR